MNGGAACAVVAAPVNSDAVLRVSFSHRPNRRNKEPQK